MPDETISVDIDEVIRRVKEAIATVQIEQAARAARPGVTVQVERVELVLRAVAQRGGGGQHSFRIPVFGQELGGSVDVSQQQLQTVELSLVPPSGGAQGDREVGHQGRAGWGDPGDRGGSPESGAGGAEVRAREGRSRAEPRSRQGRQALARRQGGDWAGDHPHREGLPETEGCTSDLNRHGTGAPCHRWRPGPGVNDDGRRFLQELPIRRKEPTPVPNRVSPTERIRAEIDELFAGPA